MAHCHDCAAFVCVFGETISAGSYWQTHLITGCETGLAGAHRAGNSWTNLYVSVICKNKYNMDESSAVTEELQ